MWRYLKRRSLWWYGKLGLWIALVLFIVHVVINFLICFPFYFGENKPKFVCMHFTDRIGNQMFQYAFAYSRAKESNHELIIPDDNILLKYFNIEPNPWSNYGYNRFSCRCLKQQEDPKHCAYDVRNVNLTHTSNVAFSGYFQSWVYWKDYEADIRKAFTFKNHILEEARHTLNQILSSRGITRNDGTVLIGVHIRYWEEYYNPIIGKRQAPRSYVIKAMDFFRERYKKHLFLVSSNDNSWINKLVPSSNDVAIVDSDAAEVAMATLTLTDHTVMTVGSFGWLIGWMTGGTTIYYKYPFMEGSTYETQFHSDTKDHFYPGWIGME